MRMRTEMEAEVKRDELLARLKENRAAHRDVFEMALEAYRRRVVRVLEANLESARTGGAVVTRVMLPQPEDHTDDYDRAIEMLEMDVRDTVTLSGNDFERFVRDRWEWRQSFNTNTASYLA